MKLIFKTLKWKNLSSYGNAMTEFNFKEGVSLVSGLNGQGKSSILNALCFSLYGRPFSNGLKLEDLVNNKNKKNLWTEITFESDSDQYIVTRGLKPNILKIEKNGVEEDLESTKSLIQDYIDSILGCNLSIFKQIISLSILNNKPFLLLDSKEKKDILESIFNLKVFGRMLKTLKKNHSITKNSIEIQEKELFLNKENLESLVNQIKSLTKVKDEFDNNKQKDLQDWELKRNILDGDLRIIVEKIEQLNFKESESNDNVKVALKELYEKANKEWILSYNKLETDKEYLLWLQDPDREKFERNIDELRESLKPFYESLNTLKLESNKKKSELERSVKEDSDKTKIEIITIENQISEKNKEKSFLTKDYIEKNLTEIIEKKKILTENKIKINSLKEDIELLKSKEGFCSHCKQEVPEEHKIKEISSRETNIKSLSVDNDILIGEIENIISEHIRTKNEILVAEIQKRKESIASLKSHLLMNESNLKDKMMLLEHDLNRSNRELESRKIEVIEAYIEGAKKKTCEQIESLEKLVEYNSKSKDNILEELKAIEEQDKSYIQKKNDYEKLLIQKMNIDKNRTSSDVSLKDIKVREFNVNIDELKSTFELKKKNYQELKLKTEELKKKMKVENAVEECLNETGIKRFFFAKLLPKLNESVNQYLNFFNLPLRFTFNDLFEETILEPGNIERNFKSFSGGEQFRISLSVLLSFQDLNRLINNFHPNICFWDEILDVGGDAEVVETVLEKLKELTDKNNMCTYIISHRNISDSLYIDNVISVKKERGFSHISA